MIMELKPHLKTIFTSIIFVCVASFATPAYASNEAMLELLKILVDKGSLTQGEYELLVNAAKADGEKAEAVKTEAKEVAKETAKETAKEEVAEASKDLPKITTRDKLEVASQDGNFKWKLIGRVMADYNGIDSDKVKLGSGWELRRARLGMDITLWKHWIGKFEADFAAVDETVAVKDAYIGYKGKTSYGDYWIKFGQSHMPSSWETMSSSKYMTFINRTAFGDGPLERARHLGVSAFTRGMEGRWTLHAGVFGGTVDDDPDSCVDANKECDEQWNTGFRATGIPFMQDKKHLLHIGGGVLYRNPNGDSVKISQRHGVFHTIDSKSWSVDLGTTVDDALTYNLETVGIWGPGYVKLQYIDTELDRKGGLSDVSFDGYSVEGGWFLTGESKNYNFKKAQFGSLTPNASVGRGGIGAWEAGIRYEKMDLNDTGAGIIGGDGELLTVGLNWYMTKTIRMMANYKKVMSFDRPGNQFDGDEPSAFLLRGQLYW